MIENGKKKASLTFLRDVATFFRIPVALLVGWEGPEEGEDAVFQEVKRLFMDILQARLALTTKGT